MYESAFPILRRLRAARRLSDELDDSDRHNLRRKRHARLRCCDRIAMAKVGRQILDELLAVPLGIRFRKAGLFEVPLLCSRNEPSRADSTNFSVV